MWGGTHWILVGFGGEFMERWVMYWSSQLVRLSRMWLSFRAVSLEANVATELNKIFSADSRVKVWKLSDVSGTDFVSIFSVLLVAWWHLNW